MCAACDNVVLQPFLSLESVLIVVRDFLNVRMVPGSGFLSLSCLGFLHMDRRLVPFHWPLTIDGCTALAFTVRCQSFLLRLGNSDSVRKLTSQLQRYRAVLERPSQCTVPIISAHSAETLPTRLIEPCWIFCNWQYEYNYGFRGRMVPACSCEFVCPDVGNV